MIGRIRESATPASVGKRRFVVLTLVVLAAAAAAGLVVHIGTPGDNALTVRRSSAVTIAAAKFPWEVRPSPPSLVPLAELRPGGPPPDGIPPIDHPKFVSVRAAEKWLEGREPVLALFSAREARAYRLQIMTWHEIVNDVVGGDPITVTFCPLCNSGLAFDRRVRTTAQARKFVETGRAVLDFGTSGRLYRSNLVMYDRQTKSLWIQFTGSSITGPFMGTHLRILPVQILSWAEFKTAHPHGDVLSRDTGFSRGYGTNPYVGYDDTGSSPFLFDGAPDHRLPPMERVVTVDLDGHAAAYRYTMLSRLAHGRSAVVRDRAGRADIVVFFQRGTASAEDRSDIASSRDVGTTGIFEPTAAGRRITFAARDGKFVDEQTGSEWNIEGEATAGALRGTRLKPVPHVDTFWFVWAAFRPATKIWSGK
jgi:hypothetical protein